MSKYTIGIDVGGSTTKIVGFDEKANLISPMFVRATDQITSVYGAFGKFTSENGITLENIEKIMMTGIGSAYIDKPLYGLKCNSIPEFGCIGRGGLYLSGLDKAIVVSLGTGTAIVYADKDGKIEYLGGTGIGGGTLSGLGNQLLQVKHVENIAELAVDGDLSKVDLCVGDIAKIDKYSGLDDTLTAANFGKISDLVSKADIALGLINMVFEAAAMLSIFGARNYKIRDIVLTGSLTNVPQAKTIFGHLGEIFNVNFIIPENARFSTVIGAALV